MFENRENQALFSRGLSILAGDFNSRTIAVIGFIPKNDLLYLFSNVDDEGSNFECLRENKDSIRGNNFGQFLLNI
jgi:hypothetical protein